MFILATVPRASGKTKRGGTEIEGQRGAFRERLFRQKFFYSLLSFDDTWPCWFLFKDSMGTWLFIQGFLNLLSRPRAFRLLYRKREDCFLFCFCYVLSDVYSNSRGCIPSCCRLCAWLRIKLCVCMCVCKEEKGDSIVIAHFGVACAGCVCVAW